jgi:hypothetical protein
MPDDAKPTKPPYLPWTTFQNITDELRGKGLPGKLDRTAIQGKSGSTQAHYLAALRFFDMIDSGDHPTERFKAYVANVDQRKTMMAGMLKDKYAAALALGTSSTSAQLATQFREYGLEGETGRKAIAFFLNAARFGGIQVSPYWPQTRPGGGGRRGNGNGVPKTRRRRVKTPPPAQEQSQPAAASAKDRYIDLLLTKASEDFDKELLDRIEKVIGIGEASATAQATSSTAATDESEAG